MSDQPAKKHPWAKFTARPSRPGPLTDRTLNEVRRPMPMPEAGPAPAVPVTPGAMPARRVAAARLAEGSKPARPRPAAGPKAKPMREPPMTKEAAKPKPASRERTAEVRTVEPPAAPVPREGPKPALAAELDETIAEIEELQAVPLGRKRRARAAGQSTWSWTVTSAREWRRNYRDRFRRLAAWWRGWRRSASCRVLIAFVALYALLAVIRSPSKAVVEVSRRSEEIAYLQQFLKSFSAAGGTVLAEKPHGGTELYPRGVLLKGETLSAFQRAVPGEVFTVHSVAAETNLVTGFYVYPPIFAGGAYFHLERKFNFSLYRCSYLIRKNSEQSGTLLLARVERAR